MKQLCDIAIALSHGHGVSAACNEFGGDKGDVPVHPNRQAWRWNGPGHRINKFVLVSAVDNYFVEIGLKW